MLSVGQVRAGRPRLPPVPIRRVPSCHGQTPPCGLLARRVAGGDHDHRRARSRCCCRRCKPPARPPDAPSCLNNLHQIGIGLQNYHAVYGCFPPGCIEPAFLKSNGRQFAWSALLLPYIEQQPLYATIDFSQPCYAAANAAPAAAVVPTYLCPSTPRTSPLVQGRGATDYGGLYGENIPPHPTDGSGSPKTA